MMINDHNQCDLGRAALVGHVGLHRRHATCSLLNPSALDAIPIPQTISGQDGATHAKDREKLC